MKGLFPLWLAAALVLPGKLLLAAEPSLAAQIAVEVERLRQELEPAFRGQAEGELEKAAQARARGIVARRLFADGVNGGDTNKLNAAVKLDEAVGKPAYFQSAAIKGLPPIYAAVEMGKPAVVAWLLERKSPVDFTIGMSVEEPVYQTYRAHIRQQPLQIAARNVQLEVLALLLNAGAKAEYVGRGFASGGNFADAPLLLVLEPFRRNYQLPTNLTERISAVRLLLRHGADPLAGEFINSYRIPLYPVMQADLPELLDTLLTNSPAFTARTGEGCTTLHIAASSGRTNAVAALIAQGAPVMSVPGQQFQPLQAAVFRIATPNNYPRLSVRTNLSSDNPALRDAVVEQLLKAGAQWDPFSAIVRGRTNELAALLKARPEAVRDRFLNLATPLHYAALHSQLWAIELLVQHQAPLDAPDSVGHTPLHTAIFHGRRDAAALLLKSGAPVSVPDAEGNSPLHLAATRWGGQATEAILARKPTLDATNRLGQTALDLAAQRGLADMISLLMQAGAKVRVAPTGQTSLLHSAAETANLDLLKLTLEQKLPVDARDSQGRTPLRAAIEKGQIEAARLLLEAGADINARDTNGATALHWRVRHGNDPIPDPMPAPGFSRAGASERSRDVALAAALPPSLRPTSLAPTLNPLLFLLENKADAGATNFAGQTPLHDLPQTGNNLGDRLGDYTRYISRTVELLLRYGAKLEATDTNGATPLHLATQRGNLLHLYALLAAGANLEATDRQGRTPVMLAAKANLVEVSNYLLAAGANALALDADGNTLLHLLCTNLTGIHPLPTNLVAHAKFRELAQLTNRFGSPPLHLALLNPSVLNPPPFNFAPVVAMPWGLQTNHPPSPTVLLEGLLDAGPPLDFVGTNGQTYIHLIASGTTDAAFKRIESALNRVIPLRRELLDRPDREGNTALHLAAARNHLPLVTLLLARGANPNLTNHTGHTPLLLGYLNFLGHQFPPGSPFDPLGQLLLKHGARLDIAGPDGRTPLQVAVADFRGVPASLRPAGAALDLFNALDQGDALSLKAWLRVDPKLIHARRHQHEGFPTLEQEAAQRPTKEIGVVIREAGAALTPFAALAFGWVDVLRPVLATNASFAKAEHRDRPALHWAAGSGDLDTVRAVLDAGADPQATDSAGLSALAAARSQPVKAVAELLRARGTRATVFDHIASGDLAELSALLDTQRELAAAETRHGQSALGVAVAAGKVELAAALLGAGADPDQDRKPKPPAAAPVALAAPAAPAAPAAQVVVIRGFFGPARWETPLATAVAAGNLPITKLLLKHGAATDRLSPSGFTVLHHAVANANVPLVQVLLEHGAAVNAQHLPVEKANTPPPLAGDTPLHIAARTGRTNVMEVLLRAGAQLETPNAMGQTPLGAVLFPPLDAPDQAGVGEALMSRGFAVRMGTFRPGPPQFPVARPTAEYLRAKGAKRADPPTKGSWRDALDPEKVHHPAGPLPPVGTPL